LLEPRLPTDPDISALKKPVYSLVDHYLICQPGGKTYLGPELRIHPYRRTLAPDVMFFRNPKPEWEESATYIDKIPDLTVELVSPSNRGKKWEDNFDFYRQAAFPEVWLVQLDGRVEITRAFEPKVNATCKTGELFSSPLFPGLAIDPAWIKTYPEEITRIEQFSPQIIVSPSITNPKLTKKAAALAAGIAEYFGKMYPPLPHRKNGNQAGALPFRHNPHGANTSLATSTNAKSDRGDLQWHVPQLFPRSPSPALPPRCRLRAYPSP
jgi:hypothetical protein